MSAKKEISRKATAAATKKEKVQVVDHAPLFDKTNYLLIIC